MKFQQLIDDEWEFIEPMLPPPRHTGRPRADERKTVKRCDGTPNRSRAAKYSD